MILSFNLLGEFWMGAINENRMQTDEAAQAAVVAVVSDSKKIDLKFNGMSAARVKEMAVATCGVVVAATVALTPEQKLMKAVMQLENGQMQLADMTQAGSAYLSRIHEVMSDLDREIAKLENVGKPSIFSRILGKGVATQGTVDALEKMVDVCDKSVMQLRDHTEQMRVEMNRKMELCSHVINEADELATPESMNLRNRAYTLSDKFRERRDMTDRLIKAAAQLAQDGVTMRDRADRLVDRHKAYLSGAKAAP